MAIHLYPHPCLLLEAEELIYTYVNQLPLSEVARDGPYCIPPAEMERMMQNLCTSVDPKDETVEFYFQQYALPMCAHDAHTCLARILIFTFADRACTSIPVSIQRLRQAWSAEEMANHRLIFDQLSPFSLARTSWDQPGALPFANGLGRLPIPPGLKERLLDTFSDYLSHVDTLTQLLLPVMEALEPCLSPWVARAQPFLRRWENRLREKSLAEFAKDVLHFEPHCPINGVEAALMYFAPSWFNTDFDEDNGILKLYIGTGEPWDASPDNFAPWEYRALRLLGSPPRIRMLRALGKQPMSSREIAKALDMHLGTVARDISSMQEERLLNIELDGTHRRYSVNYDALRTIAQHIWDMCPSETPSDE